MYMFFIQFFKIFLSSEATFGNPVLIKYLGQSREASEVADFFVFSQIRMMGYFMLG